MIHLPVITVHVEKTAAGWSVKVAIATTVL